jgi:hypothetical protein
MTQDPDIQKKVAEALNSLDGIQRAQPAPYFFTRLIARMQNDKKNVWENFGTFISRPLVAIATILVVVLLNSMAFFKNDSPVKSSVIEQNDPALNNAYDVASNTTNNTILTIWNPEDEQSIEK